MRVHEIMRWQWEGYERYHRSRGNLLLHMVLVPLFIAGNIALLVGIFRVSGLVAGIGAVSMVISLAIQGRGHRTEPIPPEPFASPRNALLRVLIEQWITFPRFVFGGRWIQALRKR